MADEKKILSVPDLPTAITGDGRYVLSLLRTYLKSVNEQVNLANGFTADDVDAETKGEFTRPKNVVLVFDRLGGVLNWDAVSDSKLAYYEVRTNTDVGTVTGLLERTTATSSTVLPDTASGQLYLYAVSTEGKVSNAATVTYNKRRPDAPTDISLTKNNEGTLITFLEIPTDCIGAHIYIDGEVFTTLDNVFLYADQSIKEVAIAYYDQFGEGEKAYFSCVVPNVTGFYVEKNGANLYFYWDAIAIYNVTYIVKVGTTGEWENGVELFRTKINKHRYIRPNKGDCCFMIKAMDSHNNYSSECAWYNIDTIAEINKNEILSIDQESLGYDGAKVNVYYDSSAHGLRLEQSAFNGEYILPVTLPKRIRARNWIDEKINSVSADSPIIKDCDFAVNSYEAQHVLIVGTIGDLDGVELKKYIARYTGTDDGLFYAIADGTTAATGGTLEENKHVTMTAGRWNKGAYLSDVTRLSYRADIPSTFSIGFWLKTTEEFSDCIVLVLAGSGHYMTLGYDKRLTQWYVSDTKQAEILRVTVPMLERDWLYIGISQSDTERTLFVYDYCYNESSAETKAISPLGTLTKLYCYPKEITDE